MVAQRAFAYVGAASVEQFPTVVSRAGLTSPRLMVCEPIRQWRGQVVARLNELCRLPQGWNGYGAPPVSFDTASFALRALDVACATDTPAPQVVPGPNGDVQFEWHLQGGTIEVHVRAPNAVNIWRDVERLGEDGEEIALTNDFTALGAWIADLVESTRAIEAAAA